MAGPTFDLPYFTFLLDEFAKGNADAEQAFGSHAHWGFWEDPDSADGTVGDFARAAEQMTRLVCDAAAITDGMSVLDCGCGFGGTLASVGQRFDDVTLTGLNIDIRQLRRANTTAPLPRHGNLAFVNGTADRLPFPDDSFDAVTAVECIFHFPSRANFFAEAARVLRPGGRLAITDFVLGGRPIAGIPGMAGLLDLIVRQVYGKIHPVNGDEYLELADRSGLAQVIRRDINDETMPTFDTLARIVTKVPGRSKLATKMPTKVIQLAQKSGAARYELLAFENNAATHP